jgi:DNA-binding NtrC family response regulator
MQGTRVLLVDDEREYTDALTERMETRGLVVRVASNGMDALTIAEEETFDAVLLDLAMPGMNGLETLKLMIGRNPDVQVILVTGQATLESGLEAMRSGAMEVMTKPVKIDDLMIKIAAARDKHEQLSVERIENTLSDIMSRKGW